MTESDYVSIIEETKPTVLAAVRKYLFKSYYEYIDDVCQEVYYKAYKGLSSGTFRGEAKAATWLYRIACNEAMMMNRHLTRKKKLFERAVNDYAVNEQSEEYDAEKSVFHDLVMSLPEPKRQIFERFVQNVPLKDIAAEFDMNESTVKSVIYRTRKQLVSMMKNETE